MLDETPIRLLAPATEVGDLFTRLVTELFVALGYDELRQNVHKAGREVDVQGRHRGRAHHLLFAECKATKAPIGGDALNKFADEVNAVGCFPGGASPCGCEEMVGNVWEWTRSAYAPYPYAPRGGREDLRSASRARRVLRGGSFVNLTDGARCAARARGVPADRVDGIGFRVVVLPFSSGL